MMRIGSGFDVHRFGEGDHIMIGGVRIDYQFGLIAHSDGDVLLHALADALLGALALGDIGQHFADHDPQYANIDSRHLLRKVIEMMRQRDFQIVNIDATLIAQAPKFAPYIKRMRELIADDCGIAIEAVSVKATTTETLGFTGRKEGIAAQAVVLLESI